MARNSISYETPLKARLIELAKASDLLLTEYHCGLAAKAVREQLKFERIFIRLPAGAIAVPSPTSRKARAICYRTPLKTELEKLACACDLTLSEYHTALAHLADKESITFRIVYIETTPAPAPIT